MPVKNLENVSDKQLKDSYELETAVNQNKQDLKSKGFDIDSGFKKEQPKEEDLSNTYRGIKEISYQDKGTTADPELTYKGQKINYHDLEDSLWEAFKDERGGLTEEEQHWGENKNMLSPEVEDEFNEYVKEHYQEYADNLVTDLSDLDEDRHDDYFSLKQALGEELSNPRTARYDDRIIETDDGDYLVLTDEEADEYARESVENIIDDIGLESFTPNFQEWILDNAFDKDKFADLIDEMKEDYEGEEDTQEWLESMKDDPRRYFSEMGYEDKDIFKNYSDYFDKDKIIDEVISEDGRAMQIASYDFNEIELPNGKFAYRIN